MTAGQIVSGEYPALGEVAGHSVTLHYGDIAAEYAARGEGAMLVDRSLRGRMRFDGPKAAEMLTGLVTNDVLALTPGHEYRATMWNGNGTGTLKTLPAVRADARGIIAVTVPEMAVELLSDR